VLAHVKFYAVSLKRIPTAHQHEGGDTTAADEKAAPTAAQLSKKIQHKVTRLNPRSALFVLFFILFFNFKIQYFYFLLR
jgi:hypothetical protein